MLIEWFLQIKLARLSPQDLPFTRLLIEERALGLVLQPFLVASGSSAQQQASICCGYFHVTCVDSCFPMFSNPR